MHRSVRIAVAAAALLALTACAPSTGTTTEQSPLASAAPAAIEATDIVTMDDGVAWARSLTADAPATEISTGMGALMDLVPEQDIWFATNNEIGRELNALNAEVLSDPEDAGTKVDDLNAIVDDIEAAIEHGPKP